MIGVLDVLHVELPVVGKRLRIPAEHDGLASRQDAFDAGGDRLAQIFLERGHRFREAAEHQPVEFCHPQLARPVVLHAERRRHAALAFDAVLEGDADEVALPVVGPGVVDAAEVLGIAARLERDQSAPVRAAVLEGVELAVGVARHDHRSVADGGGAEVAHVGHLRGQAQKIPQRALEKPALLRCVDLRVLKQPVGDAGKARLGPSPQLGRIVGRACLRLHFASPDCRKQALDRPDNASRRR